MWNNKKFYKNAFFIILICKNLKIWNIQIQGLFKDFQGPEIFFSKFKDFQELLKDPMNPVSKFLTAHRHD